jgi:hypothetical protein
MMTQACKKLSWTSLIFGLLLAASATGAAAEEQKISAFSAWQGRGQAFETGVDHITFVGSFFGMIYVETEKGPLDAGYMVCPVTYELDMKTGNQKAVGRCTIATRDDDRVYADMTCAGVSGIGCKGKFTLTGGTGKFEGVVGGGDVTIRSSLHEFASMPGNTVQETAAGIIYWRDFKFTLKGQ